ncbi:MAG: Farnesyl pyrophosphate synthetase [Alyxoria varia]|nr:MAG: Farnesyl pyrophosphate synthetase [Alyxoria varia]
MPTSLADFETVFPSLIEDLSEHCRQHNLPTNSLDWFQKSLKYNTLGGKCNRGLSVPDSISLLLSDPTLTIPSHPSFAPAATLGWLVELLQAFFLVSDDIMDHSQTRRGQPCWYLQPHVGMIAINDAFMLEGGIYVILKNKFRGHPSYAELLELFHDVTWRTEMGQCVDLLTAGPEPAEPPPSVSGAGGAEAEAAPSGKKTKVGVDGKAGPAPTTDLSRFSLDKYWFIVRYKTAFYSFYLPVALALHYCQLASPENLKQAEDILIPMGEYFQVQDDYLDCFADPATLGKIGTDIADNKCSWLICQALERVTPEQRGVLDENYGRGGIAAEVKEPGAGGAQVGAAGPGKPYEDRVKELYKELELEKVYKQYEERVVKELREKIAKVDESRGLKKELFEEFLRKIYGRSK